MWPFNRKDKHAAKNLYRVSYVAGAFIDGEKVHLDLKHLQDIFVEADDLMEAQVTFAKKMALTPHVYIHEIKKVITILLE